MPLTVDPDHPGLYLIGSGLTADPDHPGLYLIAAGLAVDPDHPGLYLITTGPVVPDLPVVQPPIPELVWLHNLAGLQVAAVDNPAGLEHDEQLQASQTLKFTVRADDPRADYLGEDLLVQWAGIWFRIAELTLIRDAGQMVWSVSAEARWIELISFPGPHPTAGITGTISAGLTAILTGTGWAPGAVDTDGGQFTFTPTAADTCLSTLRTWATMTDRETVFDTAARTVSLLAQQGSNKGLGFRYGRNLIGVQRKAEPVSCTRLYPIGKDGLTVAGANPTGNAYIDNFDYYLGQGMTLADATANYLKVQRWTQENYEVDDLLYAAGVRHLAALAVPRITYTTTVADLSALPGMGTGETYDVGDTCRVWDGPTRLQIDRRIVRKVTRPLEPQNTTVELGFLERALVAQASVDQAGSPLAAVAQHTAALAAQVATLTGGELKECSMTCSCRDPVPPAAARIDVQAFGAWGAAADYGWTKPATGTVTTVYLIGGGGGGASGSTKGADGGSWAWGPDEGGVRSGDTHGGNGGGGGGCTIVAFLKDSLPDFVTAHVGEPGTGALGIPGSVTGAAQGWPGSPGGNTFFGNDGTAIGAATAGGGQGGLMPDAQPSGALGGIGTYPGSTGGVGAAPGSPNGGAASSDTRGGAGGGGGSSRDEVNQLWGLGGVGGSSSQPDGATVVLGGAPHPSPSDGQTYVQGPSGGGGAGSGWNFDDNRPGGGGLFLYGGQPGVWYSAGGASFGGGGGGGGSGSPGPVDNGAFSSSPGGTGGPGLIIVVTR